MTTTLDFFPTSSLIFSMNITRSLSRTLHAHLDHDTCLEVVLLRGRSGDVQELADKLISTKGVGHEAWS